MKSILRFAGFILADILVSVSFWFLVLTGIREDNIYSYSLIYIPLGLAAASTLIGFLTQPLIKKKFPALMFLSPGFHMTSFLAIYTLYGYLAGGDWDGLLIILFLSCFIWTVVSLFGTLWGFNFRARRSSPRYAFDLNSDTTKE